MTQYCYKCKQNAQFIWIGGAWNCCSCNPLLLPDPILKGFTIEEVINMKRAISQFDRLNRKRSNYYE